MVRRCRRDRIVCSSFHVRSDVYTIQLYVIKCVSDLGHSTF